MLVGINIQHIVIVQLHFHALPHWLTVSFCLTDVVMDDISLSHWAKHKTYNAILSPAGGGFHGRLLVPGMRQYLTASEMRSACQMYPFSPDIVLSFLTLAGK